MIPSSIQNFIEKFSKLPSLGPRLTTRLAFYLANLDRQTFVDLEMSFADLKKTSRCEQCFFLKENTESLCDICSDIRRDKNTVAIVEKETDLFTLEKTGKFNGNYLLVGDFGERNPLETAQKLRLQALKNRIEKEMGGKIGEIIIALSPTSFGDFATELIKQYFANCAGKITRLGRGIPTGGEIEFADEDTLTQALERRN